MKYFLLVLFVWNHLLFKSRIMYNNHVLQDDVALKQKMKEDKKKMEEARAKATQRGPMGM